jgi:hypothetical protein
MAVYLLKLLDKIPWTKEESHYSLDGKVSVFVFRTARLVPFPPFPIKYGPWGRGSRELLLVLGSEAHEKRIRAKTNPAANGTKSIFFIGYFFIKTWRFKKNSNAERESFL